MKNPIYQAVLAEWKENPAQSVSVRLNETAKLIRGVLKSTFPGQKFSVRGSKYAGGSSLRVSWTDGPTENLVEAYINGFKGGSFDGMIDMKFSYDGWLYPDGSASLRGTGGTSGSAGVYEGWTEGPNKDGGIPVRFGGDFLFIERCVSPEAMTRVCQAYAAKYPGTEMSGAIKAGECGIEPYEYYDGSMSWRFKGRPDQYINEVGPGSQYGGQTVLMAMAARRMLPAAMPRVKEAA